MSLHWEGNDKPMTRVLKAGQISTAFESIFISLLNFVYQLTELTIF